MPGLLVILVTMGGSGLLGILVLGFEGYSTVPNFGRLPIIEIAF